MHNGEWMTGGAGCLLMRGSGLYVQMMGVGNLVKPQSLRIDLISTVGTSGQSNFQPWGCQLMLNGEWMMDGVDSLLILGSGLCVQMLEMGNLVKPQSLRIDSNSTVGTSRAIRNF